MSSLQYLRFVAYALFAIGLINLRYQSGESNLALRTLIIVGTGVIIFVLSYLKVGRRLLIHPVGKVLTWLVAIAVIIFAIVN
ncbi:MAG: hypothetical protein EBZ79_01590 [Actinobacteria bacterium]|nr:hypothetical protein [Actinomycetota bacterium]NBO07018.1 hypothetical protein [Actinomycetota bacterium]NBP42864.1 hypothetical protein [Actinomycetota bacterium]NBQ00822.1 hypothetical protein [Actinomycetota bacterium]NBY50765.1 hypothetical protein [Actinomycetota bacterium]